MYTSFFGLSEKPFAITPDPRYLYLSERHAEALAHLLYGINESGGFIQLTGEVGTGKTTVVRTLLARIPQHTDVAVILNPRVTPVEFVQTICQELGLHIEPGDRDSVKEMIDCLNEHLLAAHAEGRRIIVIVDEAQNLAADTLEQVRLLTNLETATQKLLQIILIGQPELRDLLARHDLRQLAQRITGRYHLMPLSRDETTGYVTHRLRVAGAAGEIFTAAALQEVHRLTGGVPRVINVTCDRALLGAYTLEARKVTPALIRQSAGEVYGRRFLPQWVMAGVGLMVGVCVFSLSVAAWQGWTHRATTVAAVLAKIAHQPVMPAVAPPTRTQPPVSINDFLAANAANTTDAAAFRRLLSLWGTAMTDDHDPCGQAQKAGLACLDQRGSWAQVRALNRPAILSLLDEKGQKHRVVLSALDDEYATLDVGEQSKRLPVDELSRDWFGDFTLVWKPKTTHARELTMGMHGDEVRWLRRSLNALHGSSSDPERSDVYDEELAIAVQNFQREHRLNVDGIAGLQTQVVLDTALADPGSPLLSHSSPRG